MYIPKIFEEPSVEVMHNLIRSHPLSTLITLSGGSLNANHIPLHLTDSPEPYGTLRGHVARANPLLTDLASNLEALAVFHGPESYISPSWYSTKSESGRAIPTWNFTVVHAYGIIRTVDDKDWLQRHLNLLSAHSESVFEEQWEVTDAPLAYIDKLMSAIVGIEMVITRMVGKWKISQNQPDINKASVVAGLRQSRLPDSMEMALMVESGMNKNI